CIWCVLRSNVLASRPLPRCPLPSHVVPSSPTGSNAHFEKVRPSSGHHMRPLRTIASTLAVAILATSCGADGNQERDTAANTQGVTDDTIVIGTHQPLT